MFCRVQTGLRTAPATPCTRSCAVSKLALAAALSRVNALISALGGAMGFDVDDFLDSTYRALPRLLGAYMIRLRDQVWGLWFKGRTLSDIITGPTKVVPGSVANNGNEPMSATAVKPILS